MSVHRDAMSAVRTERLGSFLTVDLEPSVAASLYARIYEHKGRNESNVNI